MVYIPLSTLKRQFNKVMKMAYESNEPICITRYGKKELVIMPQSDFKKIKAQL